MNLTSDSLNVFIDEMLSRAELRRTKADSYYADLLKKWKTTREALESSMADSNKTTEEIFSLLETYFDLDVKMMAEYDRTIYIQAWADCIRLLTQYGWIDYKDFFKNKSIFGGRVHDRKNIQNFAMTRPSPVALARPQRSH